MPDDQTPNLKLPYIMAAQAQKHVTHNEAIRTLDAVVQLAVLDKDLTLPPVAPFDGQRYIVAAAATGAWAARSNAIAAFQDGAWSFLIPQEGWLAWVADEDRFYAFDGTNWSLASGGSSDPVPKLGINATADTINRLVVAAPASLFNHDGAGHQQKINKANSAATASQLYQVGFSGRAEIGLAGDDDFHFKVSPNGAAWSDALVLKASTGTPRLPSFAATQLPSAAAAGAGAIVNVPDEIGGAVLAFSDGTAWRRVTDRLVVTSAVVPLLILSGESNAGGLAVNAYATVTELMARSAVQILNNTSLSLEPLQVGVNNLIGHATLAANATHGFELGLANTVDAGRWTQSQIYMVKTGQGGSTIAQWASGNASGYWTTALARFNAVKAAIQAAGKTPLPVIVWSQGINDMIANTAVATWKAQTMAHFARLRTEWGAATPILMTAFTNPPLGSGATLYATYNTAMAEIAAADPNTFVIDTADATAVDPAHWDYRGLLTITERIVDQIAGGNGTLAQPLITPASGTFTATQTVAINGPVGATLRYTTNGETPTSHSPVFAAPITVTATQTIKAVAFRQSFRNSAVASASITINAAVAYVTWTGLVAAAQSGDYLACSAGGTNAANPSGGRGTTTIDATLPFSVIVDMPSATETEGAVVYLDDEPGTNYVWNEAYVAGVHNYQGGLYTSSFGGSVVSAGSLTWPALVRLQKSGTDVVVAKSADNGATWSIAATLAGVLAGKTTLYLKALFYFPTTARRVRAKIT